MVENLIAFIEYGIHKSSFLIRYRNQICTFFVEIGRTKEFFMRCNKMKKKDSNPVETLMRYLSVRLKTVGVKLTYTALLLYYAYQRSDTPTWAKNIIIGSLAYLISPIDAIPDLTPFLGFTDDIGVLSLGLVTIACYIDDAVREKSKFRLHKFFKVVDEEDLLEVDARL